MLYDNVRKQLERFYSWLASLEDILRDAIKNYQTNGNVNQAAAISLYALLSLIPLFVLTMILTHHFLGTHTTFQHEMIEAFRNLHPYFSESLLKQLGHIEQKKKVLGWIGIITLVWFSAMIFNAIETAMNVIFRSRKNRNYIVSKLLAISMIPMGWTIGIVSIGLTYISTLLAKQSILLKGGEYTILSLLHGAMFRYVLPYCLMVFFVTIVYKIIPTVKISWGQAITAAAIFSALMEIAKQCFTWYVASYTRYGAIFGSLETVVILVFWVFYVALIFLFCAELIYSYQRRNLILLENTLLKTKRYFKKSDERLFKKFGRLYPKGTYIFNEGDTGQEMYYVITGKVRVEKSAGQVKKVLAEMGPGEYFGEMAALIDAPRTASALATEDSSLAVIDGNTFQDLLRESEEVSILMLKEFSRRIKHTNAALDELTRSWIKLIVILYFLKSPTAISPQSVLEDLSRYTRKEPDEIREVIKDFIDRGILIVKDSESVELVKEKAWDLLDQEIFFPERRSKKRPVDVQI